jgi:hypothetical protein
VLHVKLLDTVEGLPMERLNSASDNGLQARVQKLLPSFRLGNARTA